MHSIAITLEVESDCDSTIALEDAVAASICGLEMVFSVEREPEVSFTITAVKWRNGTVDCGGADGSTGVRGF